MIINHNLPAMNAQRQMSINNSTLSKSLEKLSSGLAINRASDNAAGLAISEKMRGQISGLNQASTNAQDGISLIQTAEGALNETHSILQRMRELAVQSANGTYQDAVDRENIQKEVEALKSEVDRIATSTHYNNIKLLDGSLGGVKSGTSAGPIAGDICAGDLEGSYISSNVAGVALQIGTNTVTEVGGENAQWSANGMTLTLNLVANHTYTQSDIDSIIAKATQATGATASPAEFKLEIQGGSFKTGAAAAAAAVGTTVAGAKATITESATILNRAGAAVTTTITANRYGADETVFTFAFDADAGKENVEVTAENSVDGAGTVTAGAVTVHLVSGKDYSDEELTSLLKNAGLDYTVSFADSDATIGANATATTYVATALAGGAGIPSVDPDDKTSTGKGLTFQIGANGSEDQRVSLAVKSQSTTGLGISGIDCSTQEGANKAIATIDAALNSVSGTRADLGALQNRLEHTINSLGVASENLTAAESRIRDVDMAKEMMNFTKTQILSQAAQAMLAQANTLPQGVLQLLR